MARYMVELPHTEAECLKTLDEILAKGPDYLARFDWACMSGEHNGWAIFEGKNESDVRKMLTTTGQKMARIRKVDKFTPDMIKGAHQHK